MAKETAIGERRHRVRIEEPVTSRGTSGQELIAWEIVCEVWCKVSNRISGSMEGMMAEQPISQTATVFDIAFRNGITAKMRAVFENEYYNILFTQRPDFRKSLLIYAEKQV